MPSILIVDDEERIRRVYRQMFEKEGYEVHVASNAPEAKEMLVNCEVNLILLDINMGEVGGEELYEVIQSFHKNSKIIVSSVYSLDDQKEKIPDAADYFDKSESVKVLVKKVKKLLPEDQGGLPRKNILVIDDDTKVRKLLHDLLTNAGYHSVEYFDKKDVLEYLQKKSKKIDLVILDLAMPQVDGMDYFETIKSKYPHLKIIIASNYPIDDQESMIFDADDYYEKTDSNKVLLEKINRLFKNTDKTKSKT